MTPQLTRNVDFSSDVRGPILAGLRGVVADGAGTANPAFTGFPIAAFPVSGKTGTAQVWKKHDTALFVGFGGPDNRFVVAVVLEQAGFGGQAAAPVARRIFEDLQGIDNGEVSYVTTGPLER
jgi:penicillin-binding protein 2